MQRDFSASRIYVISSPWEHKLWSLIRIPSIRSGHVAQSVAHMCIWLKNHWSQVQYPVRPHTFVSSSTDSRRAVVSYWQKYVQLVQVSRLGALSLPRNSVVRLINRPNMTIAVYHGRKTTTLHYIYKVFLMRTHQRIFLAKKLWDALTYQCFISLKKQQQKKNKKTVTLSKMPDWSSLKMRGY